MAILTAAQLTELRQRVQSSAAPNPAANKTQINLAIQAIEDYYETTARPGFGAAIETAVPGRFTPAQKKQIGKFWMLQKAGRE